MPFIPVTDVGEFALKRRFQGQDIVTVFHFETTLIGGWTEADLITACNEIVAVYQANVQPVTHQDYEGVSITGRDLTTQTSPSVEVLWSGNSGAAPQGPSPASVCMAIKKSTGLTGRSFRGRWFHSGFWQGQIAGNSVVTASADAIVAAYEPFLDSLNFSLTGGAVLVSRYNNGVPRAAGVVTPITSLSTDYLVDSQRRRLTGRGS